MVMLMVMLMVIESDEPNESRVVDDSDLSRDQYQREQPKKEPERELFAARGACVRREAQAGCPIFLDATLRDNNVPPRSNGSWTCLKASSVDCMRGSIQAGPSYTCPSTPTIAVAHFIMHTSVKPLIDIRYAAEIRLCLEQRYRSRALEHEDSAKSVWTLFSTPPAITLSTIQTEFLELP
ncbi:hypothetical protein PHSY_001574 [Pseudozyma hubeiensis SY62]|uniref:Uncharacterized protein n=1 Tax=Pseudozyma hubeiensis (strain SY62) TaxID=1305764 RepID=R9P7D0_PSEHS|nr:hypothetical protein PHSY_001574 [Pseudozyma hubeiensis SY62]GAC94005.1 hypothetical protein PHSY_001574 [Pseudozyma hubeiensis SY62]